MQETAKMVIEALKPVAEKIGEGAAHLYEIYTRQMFAEGMAGLVISSLLLIATIVFILSSVKIARVIYRNVEKGDDKIFFTGLFSAAAFFIVCGIFFGGATRDLTENITKVVNPEYHAINRLFEQVKGK